MRARAALAGSEAVCVLADKGAELDRFGEATLNTAVG